MWRGALLDWESALLLLSPPTSSLALRQPVRRWGSGMPSEGDMVAVHWLAGKDGLAYWSCSGSLKDCILILRMLCSVSVPEGKWHTVSDLSRKTRNGMKWPCTHHFKLPPGWPGRSCIGGEPASAEERPCCCTSSQDVCTLAHVCINVIS